MLCEVKATSVIPTTLPIECWRKSAKEIKARVLYRRYVDSILVIAISKQQVELIHATGESSAHQHFSIIST